MILSAFCIQRPVFTILLMMAILVGGIAGYRALPVSALPRVDFPTVQVSAGVPGASPETMASSVATPLEKQFSTIAGVTAITSSSTLGSTQITLQFDLSRDLDGAALDVQTAISAAQNSLPTEMPAPPSFRKINPADQPILFIAVGSDTLPVSQINEYADTVIGQRLSTLPGVAQVQIYGAQKYAVRIQANPEALTARDISLAELREAIRAFASNAPVGVISGDRQTFTVAVSGQPGDAAGFRPLVVAWRNGAPVRLEDVALVSDSVEDTRAYGAINGKRAVVIAVQRQPDANTVEVVKRVRALLPAFQAQLPPSVTVAPMFDRSVAIQRSVTDVQFTLQVTIGLVILVIFLFLRRVSSTVIPAIVVPLSIVATYGGMALLGFSINNVSLLALTLCVGLVVDDAIVVLENTVRHIESGMKPMEAALKGANEVGFTIVSITLSLVAVFIPVLFMGGIVGRLFREFAVTLSLAVLVSGVIALTLTPMLCSRWLKKGGEGKGPEPRWSRALERGFDGMLRGYGRALDFVLHHKRLALLLTLASFAATGWAFVKMPKGFFPLEDTGFVFAMTEGAQDISFDAMLARQKEVAATISADPAVDKVFFAVGGRGNAANAGRLFFGLKPHGQRPPAEAVIGRLRPKLAALGGINVFMQPVQNIQIGGRPSKNLYQYTLQGTDLEALYGAAGKLERALATEPGFLDVSTDLQLKSLQALVVVNRDKAASLGVSFESLRQALYAAFGNAQVATLYKPSNDYQVILEVEDPSRRAPGGIGKLHVRGADGKLVPLDTLATIVQTTGPLSINHQGQMPAVTLSFNLAPGFSLGQALERLNALERKLERPSSVTGAFQGAAQAFQESAAGQAGLLLVAVLVIYIVLGMLYESFIHPLTILSGIPVAGLGGVLALWAAGMDFSVIALIGMILLIGIVKKNAIMMVDFAIAARRRGQDAESAIREACLLRFRPIMMTTMAALLGALPLAIGFGAGGELRQPLGLTIVGGLLTSQTLTLFITPVVYLYLERLATGRERRQGA